MRTLEDLITATRDAGRAAWPQIEVANDALERVLAPLVEREAAPAHLADLYFVAGCIAGLPSAAAVFEESLLPVVARTVRKLGATADEIDEVQQHVRTVALLAVPGRAHGLARYRGDGSISSWIRVVASREAYRLIRTRSAAPATDDDVFELMTAAYDPEAGAMKASYRDELRAAVRTAIEALPRRERTALRLSVLDGVSIDVIGKMFAVHRATAARWLERAREGVLRATRTAITAQLGIAPGEFDSILRMFETGIDVSIATALDHSSQREPLR